MAGLNFKKFSDFKNRWGIEPDLHIDTLNYYFNFFRESLIDFEDDNIITKYYLAYKESVELDRVIIFKNDISKIDDKIRSIVSSIKDRSTLLGHINGSLVIYTNLFLPSSQNDDITSILEKCIESVNFLKKNGEDLGFECNIKINSPEGLRIEILKSL
jgi:hypothetical protein